MGYRTKLRFHNWGISNSWEASKEMFKVLSDQRNANQNDPKINLIPVRMAKIKTSCDNICQRGSGERGAFLHCWWDCKLVQPLWKSIWRFLRKFEIDLPEDPAILLLGIYPKDAPPWNRGTCSIMFIAAIFVIARTWKQPRCPRQKNGYRKYGSFTQWNTTQLLRTRTSWIVQANRWN